MGREKIIRVSWKPRSSFLFRSSAQILFLGQFESTLSQIIKWGIEWLGFIGLTGLSRIELRFEASRNVGSRGRSSANRFAAHQKGPNRPAEWMKWIIRYFWLKNSPLRPLKGILSSKAGATPSHSVRKEKSERRLLWFNAIELIRQMKRALASSSWHWPDGYVVLRLASMTIGLTVYDILYFIEQFCSTTAASATEVNANAKPHGWVARNPISAQNVLSHRSPIISSGFTEKKTFTPPPRRFTRRDTEIFMPKKSLCCAFVEIAPRANNYRHKMVPELGMDER